MFHPILYPLNVLSQAKSTRNDYEESYVFPLNGKNKKKIYFFLVNTKNISSRVLKILAISLVLRTHEITDVFITFDEIYGIHLKKSKYPVYIKVYNLAHYLFFFKFKHTVELQWLEHLWDHENMFETGS